MPLSLMRQYIATCKRLDIPYSLNGFVAYSSVLKSKK